jgi:serine/threonine-protein kinase
MPVAEGELVAGRFRLEHELGRGGMGSVWRAHQVSLDTPCAVKFIEGEGADLPEHRARFEREAKAAAQLRSPNVVQILDHGVWQNRPYIAMELLEGEDLGRRLERVGRLDHAETVDIVAQVARALAKAHAAGIVHRDLKPDNVFLVRDDDREVAKVLDFGIAKTQRDVPLLARTRTGALLGTPHYMSPEQAKGTGTIDARSDLWSLGVIAFECVTGKRPFESEALGDLFSKIMHDPVPIPSTLLPDVPPAFDGWWARASARPVDERFQSAREQAESLAEALGVDTLARKPSIPSDAQPAPLAQASLARTEPALPSPRGVDYRGAPTFTMGGDPPNPPPRAPVRAAPRTFDGQARVPQGTTPPSRGWRRPVAAIALVAALAALAAGLFIVRVWGSRPSRPPGASQGARERPVAAPLAAGNLPEPSGVLVSPSVTVEAAAEPAANASTSASVSPAGAPRLRPFGARPRETAATPPAPTAAPAATATPTVKPASTGPRID